MEKLKLIRNILLRILAVPFVLGIILLKYNYHAIHNVICFLLFGGEWITYAEGDKKVIQDIFMKLKQDYEQ